MKRTAVVSKSLIEHWNNYLLYEDNESMMADFHTAIHADIGKLEQELAEIPMGHWRKLRALRNEYTHWLYLMEIIGAKISAEEIPF